MKKTPIQVKPKQCKECGYIGPLFSSGRCKKCTTKDYKPIAKTQTKIKPVSTKLSRELRKYSSLREQFLRNHPICQAKVKCRGKLATEVHHKRGRGKYLLDTTTWLATCHDCHCWIEINVREAKELGLSENRLNTI
jgi:hypothetical protein